MSLQQPIMPFKWRPFDLYNDIHVSRGNDESATVVTPSVCSTSVCSTCARCQSNCDHLMLWGNFRKHRQSSRGSSSGSSCASLSTTSHFNGDVDGAGSISTIKSNGSLEYYHKLLGQSDLNRDKFKCAHHQHHRIGSHACNDAAINACCATNCRNIIRNRASIYNGDTNCKSFNSILAPPTAKCTEQAMKTHQITVSNEREQSANQLINSKAIACDPHRMNECNKRNEISGYFDNWQLNDNNTSISNRSMDESKYEALFNWNPHFYCFEYATWRRQKATRVGLLISGCQFLWLASS